MKKGNVKVSVLYPNGEGKKFNMDYYCNKHMPMVQGLLSGSVLDVAVEKGLGGGEPGSPAEYAAMGHLYFDSLEAFQNSFGPHAEQIMGDLPNYTNIEPIIQISDVII